MRLKRGSMVEVLSKKDPLNAWRCAEIVADDGDGYTVRYYRGSGRAKDGVNKVLSEAVRPCPRSVMVPKDLVEGNVVEVLDGGYWRVSVIEEIMEDDYYHIRVIGSLDEFRVKNSSIRARQEWKENKWVMMDKGSENCEDLASRMHKKSHVPQSNVTNVWEFLESDLLFTPLKRSSPDHAFTDKAYSRSVKKQRLAYEEVDLDAVHGDAYSFTGKVDFSANHRENLDKNILQTYTGSTINLNKAKNRNRNNYQFLARNSDLDDCVSTVSSVGSCSIASAISDRLVSHSSAGCRHDSDSLCSDAESHSHLGVQEEVYDGELESGDSLRAHELDLHGYRCVLESLYASGPLSWLQEIALTNLRLRLRVSNDEHLSELRRLKCIGDR